MQTFSIHYSFSYIDKFMVFAVSLTIRKLDNRTKKKTAKGSNDRFLAVFLIMPNRSYPLFHVHQRTPVHLSFHDFLESRWQIFQRDFLFHQQIQIFRL